MDSISDEATDAEGGDTPIILICSDRRAKSEQLLVKLFSIGVYSALLGQDRSIEEVCKLIRKPRTKKEAKIYYKIESEEAKYQEENEDTVSEVEIQNIRAHYKKLGKNEDAYVDSFNNIASQYTDAQLRIIAKFLPLNVRAVLETKSPKYQSIMTFTGEVAKKPVKEEKKEDALKINFIESQSSKPKMTKPVIVPSAVDTKKVTKLSKNIEQQNQPKIENSQTAIQKNSQKAETKETIKPNVANTTEITNNETASNEEMVVEKPKRGRGRPKKIVPEEETNKVTTPKRGRGRPKKVVQEQNSTEPENNEVNLFELEEKEDVEEKIDNLLPGIEPEDNEDNVLPGIEEENEDNMLPGMEEESDDEITLPQVETSESSNTVSEFATTQSNYAQNYNTTNSNTNYNYQNTYSNEQHTNEIIGQNNLYQNIDIESLLTRDKKIVAFVGTTKNGTSFLVNNLGELFSSMGINTAILDVTKNKNSYYIYTKNEEELRRTALNCMNGLANGEARGIQVNKNLTVYTSLPTEDENENYNQILSTLVKNYSLVLLDCDFDTNIKYFENAQEIYLVQTMDILTIQPLTAFLRELKAQNALAQEKIRIVINKQARIRTLNSKVIIGGMAYYNDPAMSFMTELFDKDNVKHCEIPFDEQVYSKYLEGLVNCKISLNGYSKNFMVQLKSLGNMVYPLLSNKYKPVDSYERRSGFSSKMDNTLEQMKRNY